MRHWEIVMAFVVVVAILAIYAILAVADHGDDE